MSGERPLRVTYLDHMIAAGARERARELAPAPVAQRWSTLYRALSGGRRMG